jgi:glycine dehydrogenase subunit 2
MAEPTVFELSSPGRIGVRYPVPDVPESTMPDGLIRNSLPLPELSEQDIIRHYTRLSKLNYSVDGGLYPLGSCTMKYNPRVNEKAARLPGFAGVHPFQPVETVQGCLALMYNLQLTLAEISGFKGITLQPAAGAQGEFVGVAIIRAYHQSRKDEKRTKILIPDSAHGTNPASSAMKGFEIVPIPTSIWRL